MSQDLFGRNEVQYPCGSKACCIFHLEASLCVPRILDDPHKAHYFVTVLSPSFSFCERFSFNTVHSGLISSYEKAGIQVAFIKVITLVQTTEVTWTENKFFFPQKDYKEKKVCKCQHFVKCKKKRWVRNSTWTQVTINNIKECSIPIIKLYKY